MTKIFPSFEEYHRDRWGITGPIVETPFYLQQKAIWEPGFAAGKDCSSLISGGLIPPHNENDEFPVMFHVSESWMTPKQEEAVLKVLDIR